MYGWITHRIWARQTEFRVAGVGKWMGGWAGIGTKVWRWMVTCQSSEGLSKKGKNAQSPDGIVRWVDRWSLELLELADG